MTKLYIALGVAALIAAFSFWFKATLDDNADLRAKQSLAQDIINEKDDVIFFQQQRSEGAFQRIAELEKANAAIDKDRKVWKGGYEGLIRSNVEAGTWHHSLVPDAIVDNLLLRDSTRGQGNQVRAADVAGKPEQRVPATGQPSAPGNGNGGVRR